MSDVTEILARAREREEARQAAYVPIDYKRMQAVFPKQKAALTRAKNKTDETERREAVVLACAKAVAEWDEIGAWPDDWSLWQSTLDDVFPVFNAPRLEDLR